MLTGRAGQPATTRRAVAAATAHPEGAECARRVVKTGVPVPGRGDHRTVRAPVGVEDAEVLRRRLSPDPSSRQPVRQLARQ